MFPRSRMMTGAGIFTLAWDPANGDPTDLTYSNNNRTVTTVTGTVGVKAGGVRGTVSRATGKFIFAVSVDANPSSQGLRVGINNSSTAQFTGDLSNSPDAIIWQSDGAVTLGGASLGSIASYSAGQTVYVVGDLANQLFWGKVAAGSWNNSGTANPSTGVGGLSFSTLTGPFFPVVGLFKNTGVNASATVSVVTPVGSIPSGVNNWG